MNILNLLIIIIQVLNDTGMRSCCRTCSCTDDCAYFGNCCPDKNWLSVPQVTRYPPSCVQTRQVSSFFTGEDNDPTDRPVDRYIITEFCHAGNGIPCRVGNDLMDYIFVSAKTDGQIFKNRKCAECNGVFDIISWDLAIEGCPDAIDFVKLNLNLNDTSLHQVILEKCILQLFPPASLKEKLNFFECFVEDIGLTCSNVDYNDKCEDSKVWNRHHFFLQRRTIFQNYNCFKCEHPDASVYKECIDEAKFLKPTTAFSAILDYTYFMGRDTKLCRSNEVFDPFKVRIPYIYEVYWA